MHDPTDHDHEDGTVHDHVHTEVQLNLMEISHWIEFGVEQGWIGPPMCHTHDGRPPENEELHGCGLYIRVYKTYDELLWVEENHQNSRDFKERFQQ
jgi:hypothetical protein